MAPPPDPGSDGLTRAEVWHLIEQSRTEMEKGLYAYNEKWEAGHERIRNALDRNTTTMNDGFVEITQRLNAYSEQDRALALRVHDIERDRQREAATITKRNLFGSGAVATIMGALAAWVFKKLFG